MNKQLCLWIQKVFGFSLLLTSTAELLDRAVGAGYLFEPGCHVEGGQP